MTFPCLLLLSATIGFAAAAPPADSNELKNPGFEEIRGGELVGWDQVGRGYVIDRTTAHSGRCSIRCEAKGPRDAMGVVQIIRYDRPDKRPIILGGWCKTRNVLPGGDCSVYLDVIYADGTPWWAKVNRWSRGTHDWEYDARICYPRKPVKEIRAYVFLRRTKGVAWFDDVKVRRGGLDVTWLRVASDFPHTRGGVRVRVGLTRSARWECALLTPDRAVLAERKGEGREIQWVWPSPTPRSVVLVRVRAAAADGERAEATMKAELARPRPNPVREGYAVWTRSSMRKIYPTDMPPPRAAAQYELSLARNEHEGFQIAVTPSNGQGLKNVRVRVGRFVRDDGEAFPAGRIRLYVVGFVWVDTPSGHPLAPERPGWQPDPLLPLQPFDVLGGSTQAAWVDFFAPPDAKPGRYRGTITVQPANAPAKSVAATVVVRGFALPRTPRMKTAFSLMDGFTRRTYGSLSPALRRRCLDIMLDHRLNPDDISRIEPPRVEDLLYARARGMNAFNILNLVPKPKKPVPWVCYAPKSAYGPDFCQRLAARLDPYVAKLRRHGLSKMAYVYGFDERRKDYDEIIKRVCKFVKERYPEVHTFTTASYMYRRREKVPIDYEDYMDWYCPLTPVYKPQLSAKLRAAGKQVWWYVCCGPKYPYANFASIDYPSIEGRLLAWMTFLYDVDGLLYWHVNYWGRNRPIAWAGRPFLDQWKSTCIAGMTGDGILTYPAVGGPVSSIRLENIRDGVEDYDYLCLLADAAGRDAARAAGGELVRGMREFSRSPDALLRVRAAMAARLDSDGR